MAHYECRYCDRPAGYMGIPITVGSEEICACGAEWADARILVEDDDIDDDQDDYEFEEDEYTNQWDDDDDDDNWDEEPYDESEFTEEVEEEA